MGNLTLAFYFNTIEYHNLYILCRCIKIAEKGDRSEPTDIDPGTIRQNGLQEPESIEK